MPKTCAACGQTILMSFTIAEMIERDQGQHPRPPAVPVQQAMDCAPGTAVLIGVMPFGKSRAIASAISRRRTRFGPPDIFASVQRLDRHRAEVFVGRRAPRDTTRITPRVARAMLQATEAQS